MISSTECQLKGRKNMEIKGRKVVGSPLGWVDASTGELVLSIRGLSKSTYADVKKPAKKAEKVEAEVEKETEVVETEKLPAPKKSTKKAK